jgi:hypothetical protein
VSSGPTLGLNIKTFFKYQSYGFLSFCVIDRKDVTRPVIVLLFRLQVSSTSRPSFEYVDWSVQCKFSKEFI